MSLFRAAAWIGVAGAALSLSACSGADGGDEAAAELQDPQTVTVEKMSLAPTASGDSSVVASPTFAMTATTRGYFQPFVKAGQRVSAGQALGTNAGNPLIAPVDAVVTSISDVSGDVPKDFPLVTLTYQGFGLEISAQTLLYSAAVGEVQGKFQIVDGQGPNACAYVATPATATATPVAPAEQGAEGDSADGAAKDSAQAAGEVNTENLLCLVDKGLDVRSGMKGTVVFTGAPRKDVLVLPVNAVAGRIQTGRVLKQDGQAVTETDVQLGITDGAHIEIVSGLSEGDAVLATSPDLDPRGK